MNRQLTTSDCYAAYDRRVQIADSWIDRNIASFCGYASDAVAWRFRQRCTELALSDFVWKCAEQFERLGQLPEETSSIEANGLYFSGTGNITVSMRLFLLAMVEFAVHWGHALLEILLSLRLLPAGRPTQVALVFGVGIENLFAGGDDARFLDFCHRGPVEPLARAERLVVQAVRPLLSSNAARVRYGRFPLFAALRWHGLSPAAWLRTLGSHLFALASFASATTRCRSVIVLGRDAAYHSVAVALNRAGVLQSVVLTNSNYSAQPLWMYALSGRKYRIHMAWYSQNSAPIIYADAPNDTPLPNFRFIRVDDIWVWTEPFRCFLENLGCRGVYHVVGPILWYLPEPAEHHEGAYANIAVFDVTPVDSETERRLGLLRNYYSDANATKFIEDLAAIGRDVTPELYGGVKLRLKHKRDHTSIHSNRYIDAIDTLVAVDDIVLVPSAINLYKLIGSCDVVVAMPFSSPVYVAQAMNKPAIWYDPTGSLVVRENEASGIFFAGNPADLKRLLVKLLQERSSWGAV